MPSETEQVKEGFDYKIMPIGVYKHKKGYKRSPFSNEWRKNLSKSHIGYKHPEEVKRKIGEANKENYINGRVAWNKGLKNWRKGFKFSEQAIRKMSKAKKGKKTNYAYWRGKKIPISVRRKMSESKKGEKSYLWKGGITLKHWEIRHGIEFRLWREAVFARDNWTCQKCGIRSGEGKAIYLHPHHISNFAQYPELRFAINNGITFCKKCHQRFHKKYGVGNNTKEQVEEFIKARLSK